MTHLKLQRHATKQKLAIRGPKPVWPLETTRIEFRDFFNLSTLIRMKVFHDKAFQWVPPVQRHHQQKYPALILRGTIQWVLPFDEHHHQQHQEKAARHRWLVSKEVVFACAVYYATKNKLVRCWVTLPLLSYQIASSSMMIPDLIGHTSFKAKIGVAPIVIKLQKNILRVGVGDI